MVGKMLPAVKRAFELRFTSRDKNVYNSASKSFCYFSIQLILFCKIAGTNAEETRKCSGCGKKAIYEFVRSIRTVGYFYSNFKICYNINNYLSQSWKL